MTSQGQQFYSLPFTPDFSATIFPCILPEMPRIYVYGVFLLSMSSFSLGMPTGERLRQQYCLAFAIPGKELFVVKHTFPMEMERVCNR